jgi:hypothetical protein
MSTENIVKYLQCAYTDQKLFELLAHCQDGKLSFSSCCCFIGIPTADHPLRGAAWPAGGHYLVASKLALELTGQARYASNAEAEFKQLGESDPERREKLLPLIEAEIERRSAAVTIDAEEFAIA